MTPIVKKTYRYFVFIPTVLLIVLWSSCRKDFEYKASSGNLEFSKDTVFLDTVFTNIGSSTYSLKVYNRSNDDIQIPTIRLAQGNNSGYRLNVDGVAGKDFSSVPLLAKDSMFIFIETTFDITSVGQNEFLYTDAIIFGSGGNQQEVQLVTLVKDAIFLFPGELTDGSKETLLLGLDGEGSEVRIEGFVLGDNQLDFTNEKPYVIYGYAAVAQDKTLTIAAGTRVHFHKDSGILVGTGASLKVRGEMSTDTLLLEKEVIFEGDRLEPEFTDVPGQWGTVWLAPGSLENEIEHLTLKNATVGLLIEGSPAADPPTLSIKNSQVYNSATVNLLGRNTSIQGENLVLGSAGINSLYCTLGGSYTFTHATIANYWSNGFRNSTALQLDNFTDTPEAQAADLVKADFINCIIDGNTSLELALNSNNTNTFNFSFTNCLIKFRDISGQFTNNPLYDFGDDALYVNIILNGDADFLNTANNDFRIGPESEAINTADLDAALLVPFDLLGKDRTAEPDIGAYEFVVKE